MSKSICAITREWLIANGYDGLAGDHCGCGVDDLMPCLDDCMATDCVAAKIKYCTKESCMEYIDICDGEGFDGCRSKKLYVSE